MSVLLETIGLKKYFQTAAGKLHAVDDINLKIGKGETLGVVGESGCGKSTLGRVILRLLEADAGQILFEGTDILKRTKAQMKDVRTQMQIIFQDPYSSLDPRISVIDLIREPMVVNSCTAAAPKQSSARWSLWIRLDWRAGLPILIRMNWTADAASASAWLVLWQLIQNSLSATNRFPRLMCPSRRKF